MSQHVESQTWYYRVDGKLRGPSSGDALRRLAERGMISRETMVSADGGEFQPAGVALPATFANLVLHQLPRSGTSRPHVEESRGIAPAPSPLALPPPLAATPVLQARGVQDPDVQRDGIEWVVLLAVSILLFLLALYLFLLKTLSPVETSPASATSGEQLGRAESAVRGADDPRQEPRPPAQAGGGEGANTPPPGAASAGAKSDPASPSSNGSAVAAKGSGGSAGSAASLPAGDASTAEHAPEGSRAAPRTAPPTASSGGVPPTTGARGDQGTPEDPVSPSPSRDEREAWARAVACAREHLTNPGTARFPDFPSPEARVQRVPGGFVVDGYVNANSVSGKAGRVSFECKLAPVGNALIVRQFRFKE
ncbi:MAG: DUF4339 domain-containing protein [Planctomycetes bacterium]|nr:DUF4339 domain-containing protein [Planctomycetota bacterium]